MIGAMRNVGGEYSGMAHRFEVQPSSWVLWAWDQEADPSGIYADVNVYRVESPDTATLEAFMEKEARGLPSFGASVDRQVVTVETREAGRMIEEYKNSQGEVETKSMVYVLQEGTTFWEVAYACGAADFEVWLPVFDYSFSKFTMLP